MGPMGILRIDLFDQHFCALFESYLICSRSKNMPLYARCHKKPHKLSHFCPFTFTLYRYAASVGTNFGQRGMGCALPADRYSYHKPGVFIFV